MKKEYQFLARIRHMASPLLAVLPLFMLASGLRAQVPLESLAEGTELRITRVGGTRVKGTLAGRRGDTLEVRVAAPRAPATLSDTRDWALLPTSFTVQPLPLGEIAELQAQVTRQVRGNPAVGALVVGASTGAIVFGLCASLESDAWMRCEGGEVVTSTAFGILTGAVASLIPRRKKVWERVPLETTAQAVAVPGDHAQRPPADR